MNQNPSPTPDQEPKFDARGTLNAAFAYTCLTAIGASLGTGMELADVMNQVSNSSIVDLGVDALTVFFAFQAVKNHIYLLLNRKD